MRNKALKIGIFLLYSFLIFNAYFIIGAPVIGYFYGYPKLFLYPLIVIMDLPQFIIAMTMAFLSRPLLYIFIFAAASFFLFLLWFLQFHLWWKKQTIFSAFLITLTGLLFGPGLHFFRGFFEEMRSPWPGPLILLSVCLFYGLLYLANYLQKKYWPDNKFCKRIRFILKWPCLRT